MSKTRDEVLAQARKLAYRVLRPVGGPEDHAAYNRFCRLVTAHGLAYDEVLPPVEANAKWTLDDFFRASERVKDVATTVQNVISHPDTQKTIAAGRDLVGGIVGTVKAVRQAVRR